MPLRGKSGKRWIAELRETQGPAQLAAGRPDLFPRRQVRQITDSVIRARRSPSTFLVFSINRLSSSSSSQAALVPGYNEYDDFFQTRLIDLQYELWIYETALIACLHKLSYDKARQLLHRLCQRILEDIDEHTDDLLKGYLQVLMYAHMENPTSFQSRESKSAAQLLIIFLNARNRGEFPLIWRLVEEMGNELSEELLPMALVEKVLLRARYGESLSRQLEVFMDDLSLHSAFKLVEGLKVAMCHPRSQCLLGKVFPQFFIWGAWKPDSKRISMWEKTLSVQQRKRLQPILILEGPDTTRAGHRALLRRSSCGIFRNLQLPGHLQHDQVLDLMLENVDQAADHGAEAVELVATIYIDGNPFPSNAITQVEAALEFKGDRTPISTLTTLVQTLKSQAAPLEKMTALEAAIPLLNRIPKLQSIYGIPLDISHRIISVLAGLQREFSDLLVENKAGLRHGLSIVTLAHTLSAATWLHEDWSDSFIAMLRSFPTKVQVLATFEDMSQAEDPRRGQLVDLLLERVGGTVRRQNLSAPQRSSPPVELPVVDPIWYEPMGYHLSNFRQAIKSFPGLPEDLKVACVRRSLIEHWEFVKEVYECIRKSPDYLCVRLANILGSMLANNLPVEDVWRDMLMHVMHQRPEGLLGRRAATMATKPRQIWAGNLHRVLGERMIDPRTGEGFTRQGLEEAMGRHRGSDPERTFSMLSTRTAFSASSSTTRNSTRRGQGAMIGPNPG
ncbi:hypothetical protein MKZ38_001344 [Zalerion maritima]|uniref:Uncharacterized protein n=1 Tax=Zalerion maritima TaxID=339359 RepID=A0AAD5RQF1_9PEZI|nr:hypothetical protein MKZ38_001344 [Zalerion maritima]